VIVLGQALLDSGDDAGRFFLLLRSLKILQANAGALSRAAPVDLWPMLAAFLHTLCPSWTPSGVDARRLEDHRQRLAAVMPRTTDPDVAALALEVAGALGRAPASSAPRSTSGATARRCSPSAISTWLSAPSPRPRATPPARPPPGSSA
jgi:hypothetical protein